MALKMESSSSHSIETSVILSRLSSFSLDLVTALDSEVSETAFSVSWLQNRDNVRSCAILHDSSRGYQQSKTPTASAKCNCQQSPHLPVTTSPGNCSVHHRSLQHPSKRGNTPDSLEDSRREQPKPNCISSACHLRFHQVSH